jgi:hypothetical protein
MGLGAFLVAGSVALALFFWLRSRTEPTGPYLAPGTKRMVARLQAIRAKDSEPVADAPEESNTSPWRVNRPQMIPIYEREAAETHALGRLMSLNLKLGKELLWCGRNEEAVQAFERLSSMAAKAASQLPQTELERLHATIRDQTAIAFLRMGELQNCVGGHNCESCIFPIAGGGVHVRREASQAAIGVLASCLKANPGDLGSRWLLNIAYMTLGTYPQEVPAEYLIPPQVFASEYDIKRFRDVAPALGLDIFGLAGGSILEDFDGDGFLDILASGWSLNDQLRLMRSNGDGTFTDRTEAAGLKGEVGGLNITHADYDNDGFPDVIIRRGGWLGEHDSHPNSLLHNNGNGTFDDVTEEAGLQVFHAGQVAVWGDYDNDGWVDLFLGNESDKEGTRPCQLFHNQGNGSFVDCAASSGVAALGFVKGVAWGDYNNDGRIDLYISRLRAPNLLFRNDGRRAGAGSGPVSPASPGGEPWLFTDVTNEAHVGEPISSFPTWFWDYDNDGWLDIFVAGFNDAGPGDVAAQYLGLPHRGEVPRLYHNERDGSFRDVTKAARLDRVLLTMGANFGDLDNDGFLDLYLGTGSPDLRTLMPNRMFRNAEGKYFQDVTTSGGFGHLQKGHGVAFGDIDNDGDQDIYAVLGGWYSADGFQNVLFENPGHGNHWVTLRLEGVKSNRAGIGARIRVTVKTESGPREIYVTAGTGGSFGGSSLQQEIGLGRCSAIQSIEIQWPAGTKQTLNDIPIDQIVRVREGAEALRVPLQTIHLRTEEASHEGHSSVPPSK